jgi:hypothetical protein
MQQIYLKLLSLIEKKLYLLVREHNVEITAGQDNVTL